LLQRQQQLTPLFEDTKLFTTRHDDDSAFRDRMLEKQRVYGILLRKSNLMEMTDDRVEEETKNMRELFVGKSLSAKDRVRISPLIVLSLHAL